LNVDNWKNKWPDQGYNLGHIISFKRKNPEKVKLLFGNHDTSYYLDERCSGFQPDHEFDIFDLININKHLFDVVYIEKNYIFSHAGVSSVWMKCAGIKSPEEINQLFLERPNFFRWVGPNGYGNNVNEGPLWIRIPALQQSAVNGYNQVFGHSETKNPPEEFESVNGDKLICIDSGSHDYIYEMEI
jgi:hypothetical protein